METNNLAKKQIDLIRESMCVVGKWMECRSCHDSDILAFPMIEEFVDDRGKSCLFKLKEMCHGLFRNSDSSGFREKLYDMTVGCVFHEAMKLRENLYQIEHYRPHRDVSSADVTPQELKMVREIDTLLKKSQRGVREGFREIAVLVGQLVEQLRELIKSYRDNYLLPRFLIESERSLTKIYGRKGFHRLAQELWRGGKADLLCRAGESYLESEYYVQARGLFRKAKDVEPGHERARFLYNVASAFAFYYANKYTMALRFIDEARALAADSGWGEYESRLESLTEDIAREQRKRHREIL